MNFKILFVLQFFVLYAYAAHWHGTWDWTGNGGNQSWTCVDDSRLQANFGQYAAGQFRIINDTYAQGRFYGVGYRFGGPRIGDRKNLRNRGFATLVHDGDSTMVLTVKSNAADSTRTWTLTKESDTVDGDEDLKCYKIDRTDDASTAGEWTDTDGTYVPWICTNAGTRGNRFWASYNFTSDDETSSAFSRGGCAKKGKICFSDWFEYPSWGVELWVQLNGDRLINVYYSGPGAFVESGSATTVEFSRTADSSDNCGSNADARFQPFQCNNFPGDLCEDNAYCSLDENGTSCLRDKF
jgi:hypothetical protein